MPANKDLKRLVRARMRKTGESYTTARKQLTKNKPPKAVVSESEYARLAGIRDEVVKARTGKTWKQWVSTLDAVDAAALPHKEIAQHVHDTYEDVNHWWSQMVTVGYERIRGLRDVGQRRGGGYDVNKSKTIAVPVGRLYRTFSVARTRGRWLQGVTPSVRTVRPEKSIRFTWPDGTTVQAYFTAKGEKRSQVSVQHSGLSSKAEAARIRAWWTERLAALAALLSGR